MPENIKKEKNIKYLRGKTHLIEHQNYTVKCFQCKTFLNLKFIEYSNLIGNNVVCVVLDMAGYGVNWF